MMFMDYTWSDRSRRCFYETSHRARYYKCDAISNLPPDPTPMYAIQFHHYPTKPLFNIPSSFSIVQTDVALYCADNSQLLQAVGMWERKKHFNARPHGVDTHMRLNQIPYLWEVDKPVNRRQCEQEWRAMQPYRLESVEALYLSLIHI